MKRRNEELARIIDHTNLRGNATEADIAQLCREARDFGFAAAVVSPHYVPFAVSELSGSGVVVCSVVSFPLGSDPSAAKVVQAEMLIANGVREIDMVMNIGAFLSGRQSVVEREIKEMVGICHDHAHLKLIIETAFLTGDEIDTASKLGLDGGCDFIKTSTGFGPRGVSIDDVRRIRAATGGKVGIKASGGIRTAEFARDLVRAGATRLGTSASLDVIRGD